MVTMVTPENRRSIVYSFSLPQQLDQPLLFLNHMAQPLHILLGKFGGLANRSSRPPGKFALLVAPAPRATMEWSSSIM